MVHLSTPRMRRKLLMKFYTYKTERRYREKGKDHYKSNTGAYKSWHGAKQRCTNPDSKDYKRYGGSGIGICERWLSFNNFLEDMGERPKGHELDRIDNTKGYSKENCRWASKTINMYNRGLLKRKKLPRGVTFIDNKYRARITVNRVCYFIGYFDNASLASQAYNKVALEWFGFIPKD